MPIESLKMPPIPAWSALAFDPRENRDGKRVVVVAEQGRGKVGDGTWEGRGTGWGNYREERGRRKMMVKEGEREREQEREKVTKRKK